MRKLAIASTVAISAGLLTVSAQADTIDLSYQGLHFSNSLTANTNYGHFYAGAMNFKEIGGDEQELITFCMEVTQIVQSQATYSMTDLADTPGSISGGMGDYRAGLLQSLYDSHYDDALSSRTESSAFQMAVWEIVYEDDVSIGQNFTLDVSDGDGFQVSGGSVVQQHDGMNVSAVDLANAWLSDLSWTGVTTLRGLKSTTGQDQITMIPLPAPIVLGGLGLISLPVLRRRLQRA